MLAAQLARFGLRPGPGSTGFCQRFPLGRQWDQNVIARRPPSLPRRGGAAPVVIIGAHYDSQGVAASGRHFPGADDNASGVAALLELARLLGRGAAPGVDVWIVAFGAEERGLLGSKYFVRHAPVELRRVALMINLDMVGRQLLEGQPVRSLLGNPKDTLGYVISEKRMQANNRLLQRVSKRLGIEVVGIPELILKLSGFLSDSVPFSRSTPTLFVSTSLHPDYGKVTDTPEKIDHAQLGRAVRLVLGVVGELGALERK